MAATKTEQKTLAIRQDDPARDRLLALVKSDAELSRRFADQVALDRDETKALATMLSHAHMTADKGDENALRLLDLQRLAMREPERHWPAPRPVVTIHSAAWFVEQIKTFLADEPEFAKALAHQQLALEAEGQSRADAVAIVVRDVLAMTADGQAPLDGNSPLARAVRLASNRILTSSWREERDPGDAQREHAQSARVFQNRIEDVHAHATVLRAPSTGLKIIDTRDVA